MSEPAQRKNKIEYYLQKFSFLNVFTPSSDERKTSL